MTIRRSLPITALAILVIAACRPSQAPTVETPTVAATETPSPSPSLTASATASPSPTAPATAGAAACSVPKLQARVTQWEGAAGHRIATVELKNTGSEACTLATLDRPQLVDGVDTVLIDGTPPTSTAQVTIAAGGTLHTLVQDGNYCGTGPIVPVTVAFVLPDGAGRIVAAPLTPEDSSGVPPCNGPGAPADIEMQPWST
jgi:hypothetical protein